MLDEFDEEGDEGVGESDPEHRASPVDAALCAFTGIQENDKVVEDVIQNGVGDEDGHDGGIFAAYEGLPRKFQHAAFIEGPFRDEGRYSGGPLFKFIPVFGTQECFFSHHNAFVINPID